MKKQIILTIIALLAVSISAMAQSTQTFTVKGVSFKMVDVQGGTFMMGGTSEQGGDVDNNEKPIHKVTVSSFSIGQVEVTQDLWNAVMGNNPSYYKGAKLPVEQVSWDDCKVFIMYLNGLTGKKFRLPTEAEWEYAARGGSKSQGYKYAGSNTLNNVSWNYSNSGKTTHPVASKQPNELGIYDMSGNVFEWCNDWYTPGYESTSPKSNPRGPEYGMNHVIRGGSWLTPANDHRVSSRWYWTPNLGDNRIGLRLAL